MRSTLEIIIAVKECQPTTEEELRLALMAMSSIEHFIKEDLKSLVEAVEKGGASAKLRAQFARGTLERMFYARKKPPNEWLGKENVPGTPEQKERLATAKAIYKAATGETL
jgi:hypothetical protein